jgi:hypothetical protein
MKNYKIKLRSAGSSDNLSKFLKASLKEDVAQSVKLYFSPFMALAKDFHDSMGQLKTFDYTPPAKGRSSGRRLRKHVG